MRGNNWRIRKPSQITTSTINVTLTGLVGGTPIRINTSLGKPFNFTVVVRTHNPTIDDVKAEIEEEQGIPAHEQRLQFSGKDLDVGRRTIEHYDNIVDIAAVKARKAALSKDKGTGDKAEAASELPEVGSKRVREDSSIAEPSPKYPKRGLLSCDVNTVEGVESFCDDEDLGSGWRTSRSLISSYDTLRFESISQHTLIESVANDCVRTLNVTAFLENKLKECRDELSWAENKVKGLTERKGHLEDSLRKEEDTFKKLVQELDLECSTGTSFLQSEIGRHHIATLERRAAKSAVDEFKKGYAINVLVKGRTMSVYEDTVKECQSLLRKSGQVSEDIIKLIGPQNDEEQQQENEEEEEEEEEDE